MKVFVSGRDGVGWALDVQRQCVLDSLARLGHRVATNPLLANVVVVVNWTRLAQQRWAQLLRIKKTLVLATSWIDLDDPDYGLRAEFDGVKPLASAWISPSHRQQALFTRHGLRSFYQPFYVEDVFFRTDRPSKEELCARLDIDYSKIEGRVVLASIQRDTQGSDLITPKWQKGPELLVDLVAALPDRDKYVLLLSGPRRHYVLDRCRKEGIPYVYAGREPGPEEDDVRTNLLPAELVPLLYQLTDIYLVTSRSEGGPKAVMECALLRTFILSTDVGLAPDFLAPECVFRDQAAYAAALRTAVEGFHTSHVGDLIERHYRKAFEVMNPSNMDALLQSALEGV
jgi:glycosyltransferase involved in cell wall biosynthesis